jgi:STE24 endopeptidase
LASLLSALTASLSPALLVSLIFGAAVVFELLLKFWLASRQMRAVARHRGAVPAGFAGAVTLQAHQRAADYTVARLRVGLLEHAFAAAVLLGWTLLGGLDALNGLLLAAIGGAHPLGQQLALLAAFALIGALLDLPFSFYQTFVVEQRFGFNKMTLRLWLLDLLKSALLGAVIGLPLAALALWLMGVTGAWWWLWTWGAWVVFSLLLMLIYPTLIAPLFNKFQPLADPQLAARITALLARCGFAAKGLFVMDGSRRSAHANAYFTGLGAARRVVIFDTLLAQLNPPEVEAVLAHELGHFKRRHIAKRMAGLFAFSLAALALLGWLARQDWFYTGLGVTPNLPAQWGGLVPNYALALLLFMLAAPVFGFFLSPLMAALSRRHEFEADAYAARQAGAQDLAGALLKLHRDNASTLTPDPIYARFYYSHPPAVERVARLTASVER